MLEWLMGFGVGWPSWLFLRGGGVFHGDDAAPQSRNRCLRPIADIKAAKEYVEMPFNRSLRNSEDDGCGFDPKANSAGDTQHYGIVGMRERVEQIGGQFKLLSSPGAGTRVLASVPLRRTTPTA
jgi:hypothetical protein